MPKAKKRWEIEETLKIFINSYKYIISSNESENRILKNDELLEIWNKNHTKGKKKLKIIWDEETSSLIIFLFPASQKAPVRAFSLKPSIKLSSEDLRFANSFSEVFNQDISVCEDIKKTDKIWNSLRITQFLRAISDFTLFNTLDVSSLIQAMENSMFLTYEGESSKHIILFPYKLEKTLKNIKNSYVRLRKSLSIEKALLEEKWIRAIDGNRIALLGTKNSSGSINGFISLNKINGKKNDVFYAPHESLEELQSIMEKNDIVLVSTLSGDILILLGKGIVFHKTQGHWRYLNYDHFQQILTKFLKESVTKAIVSTVLNLSFERRSSIICIIKNKKNIKNLVPDYEFEQKTNSFLRSALKDLYITVPSEKELILSAAAVDGAIILDHNGKVLDSACMIGRANDLQLKKLGFTNARIFPGTGTTAAWNASLFGIAIKISSDGQIIVFYEGRIIRGKYWF